MHPKSPPLTIGGTVLKESDDLDILGVTFDFKINFKKHFRSVSRTASRKLGILRKPGRVFHDRSLLGRWFRSFVDQLCSVVLSCQCSPGFWTTWQCSQWCQFFNWGCIWVCHDIVHRRSVAVVFMLYKIMCNPMYPLYGALPGPYVPVRVILIRHIAAKPRSTAEPLFPSQCLFGTTILTLYSMVWYWRVSRAGPMPFYLPKLLYPYYSLQLFFAFSSKGWYCGAGVFGLIGYTGHPLPA